MTLSANSSGVVSGKFTIPPNVRAGVKTVSFIGSGGSYGSASFVGQGVSEVTTRQVMTTVHTYNVIENTPDFMPPRVDPVAQTFSLPADRHISSIDLWFAVRGTSPVEVQIRETSNGFPTRTVIARTSLPAASCNIGGAHTRFSFPVPLHLSADVEYAIVVLCNDAVAELSIAELGKWDSSTAHWVTSQPYQIGVLLTSSNASTWSASQDKDLTFRINAAYFSSTSKTQSLGTVNVTSATDLILRAFVYRPDSSCDVSFLLTFPDTTTLTVAADQWVSLPAAVTGAIGIEAIFTGTHTLSPVLLKDVQLISGNVGSSATYISRAIPAGASARVRVLFDALIPAGASVLAHVKGVDVGDSWVSVPYQNATALGDGWMEIEHELPSISETSLHVRLTLGGTTAARPRVRNLRVIIL